MAAKKKIRWVLMSIVVVALAFGGYRYARKHGFSAREAPNAVETYFAKKIRRFVVPAGTKELANPLSAEPILVAEARHHFADHCAFCHANDGSGRTMIGENMYPPVPDMRSGYTQYLRPDEKNV